MKRSPHFLGILLVLAFLFIGAQGNTSIPLAAASAPAKTIPTVQLLLDVNEATEYADVTGFTQLGSTKLFFAAAKGTYGLEPWITDGTKSGTKMLADINPGWGNGINYDQMNTFEQAKAVNATVFFIADEGYGDYRLWKTGGTPETTQRVSTTPHNPDAMIAVGDELFFIENSSSSPALWKSDGTEDGTKLIKSWADDSQFTFLIPMIEYNQEAVFLLWRSTDDSSYNFLDLWKSGGTEETTTLVKTFPNSPSNFDNYYKMGVANGLLFFNAYTPESGYELWQSNGTEAGTEIVQEMAPGSQGLRVAVTATANDTLFFTNFVDDEFTEMSKLYQTRGKAAGGISVAHDNVSNEPLKSTGQLIYFGAIEGEITENKIWLARTDGTPQGKVIYQPPSGFYSIGGSIAELGNEVFFSARERPITHGLELWTTGGSPSKTHLFVDIYPGITNSIPQNFYVLNGKLVFTALSSTYGKALWVVPELDYQIFTPFFRR